jgi:hypothetical protein
VNLDPSFAGAAGGYALLTTVGDLARFLDALFAGRLFRRRATLREMLTIAPAQGVGERAQNGDRRCLLAGRPVLPSLRDAQLLSHEDLVGVV